ncbi:hypothetical protein Glove_97g106 [Diversispora epigaea]|uniref:Uncharacterized protein n=1 Tax=Diversispora epigaea TaxID=1348612 RepID=A0A397J8G8_9GLOM|nr:hypothetical protein Glove_97g106 [Diversispora epigaea]
MEAIFLNAVSKPPVKKIPSLAFYPDCIIIEKTDTKFERYNFQMNRRLKSIGRFVRTGLESDIRFKRKYRELTLSPS